MEALNEKDTDVILIGAGIMSATLGVLLKELQPDIRIHVYERLDIAAAESSEVWNNAGTGHSAFCELNYTPVTGTGSIDTTKAVKIAEAFETSKQFWAYLIQHKLIDVPGSFITRIPHMSFVWGEDNVKFLQKRYAALQQCHLFKGMEYTEDHKKLNTWMPLVMEGRSSNEKLAATRMEIGTDVNFGALTRCMFNSLQKKGNVNVHFNHTVRDLKREEHGRWIVKVKERSTGKKQKVSAKFVFIGAGGGSLRLLEKSGIPEGKGYEASL